VTSRTGRHKSAGSIWLNLAERSFRLRGEAKETKVGPLYMDMIAQGGNQPKVYANVNLTAQDEHQCVAYDYPTLRRNASNHLKEISNQGLSFFAIAQLHGEDCGIFVAPLARGRWIHIFVDMESHNMDTILRSEIHRSGQVLRVTDLVNWRVSQDVSISLKPKASWKCTDHPGNSQLAHLGLDKIPKRSIELQDALQAIRELQGSFAVLEILGLTGDVAIMVQEPELLELWRMPEVSFSYSLYLGPANGNPMAGEHMQTAGDFAANMVAGRVRMTAGALTPGATNISVALNPGSIAVQVAEATLPHPVCLILPLDANDALLDKHKKQARTTGIFNGVEAIGEDECNRFTFLGTGAHAESVELWFSRERNSVCRLEVLPPAGIGGTGLGALINVPAWEPVYVPGGWRNDPLGSKLARAPESWDCQTVAQAKRQPGGSWLSLQSEPPPSALLAAVALSKLAEASGVVGLLPPHAADTLARLVVESPSALKAKVPTTTAPPVPVDIFGPQLRTFSFSYSSTFPVQGHPVDSGMSAAGLGQAPTHRNHGAGEVRVDLARRRMFLRSEARDISPGLPQVESRVIFRGDLGRLYARTTVGADGFDQCWSVRTAEAVPPPRGGSQPNPFTRGRLVGQNLAVPGATNKVANKYSFSLNERKRAEIYVDGSSELRAINVDDLHNDRTASVLVHDWSTQKIDDAWFDPSEEWKCEELQFLHYADFIADWDLIQFFFPVGRGPVNNHVPEHHEQSRPWLPT